MLKVSPLLEIVEDELEGCLGLLHLLTAHAAGAVDDEDHRLAGGFGFLFVGAVVPIVFRRLDLRRGEEQEVARRSSFSGR